MIWKWLERHWLEVVTAIAAAYGMVMSTYNLIVLRRTKQRRVQLRISYGFFREAPIGLSSHPMLFLDVSNPGYSSATIEAPYFESKKGLAYKPPELTADAHFPFELGPGKSCSRAVRYIDVVHFFGTSCGLKGEVWLHGVVRDLTGKLWRSRQAWPLGLRNGKRRRSSTRIEQETIDKSEGNWRSFLKFEDPVPFGTERLKILLNFLKEQNTPVESSARLNIPIGPPAERIALLEYCRKEGLIDGQPIQTDQFGVEEICFIKITGKGRECLKSL